MARSRSPFFVAVSGALSRAWACRSESQLPTRTPFDLAPFTREMPAANPGASSPLSAASIASFRTAVMRTLMETEPSLWVLLMGHIGSHMNIPLGATDINEKGPLPPF